MPAQELDFIGVPVFRLAVSDTGRASYDSWNAPAARMIGRSSEDARGQSAEDVFGGRFGRILGERHAQVVETGEGACHRITLPTNEGERVFLTTLTPQFEDGRVRWIWGIWCDATWQVADREAETLRRTKAQEAESFLTMAAHDLRAPMRNVRILVEALRDDFTDLGDGKLALIDRIDTLAERASRLISDVLAHAETVATERCAFSRVALDELCLDIFGVLDPQHRHDLTVESARLSIDRPLVQIVIRNLVDNAIKHGGQDRLRLHVGVVGLGEMLAIEVEDDGKGFDDPALAFLNGGEFRYESGFGLFGLRRLVESRGGTIAVRTSCWGGGLVRVVVPGQVMPGPVTPVFPRLNPGIAEDPGAHRQDVSS